MLPVCICMKYCLPVYRDFRHRCVTFKYDIAVSHPLHLRTEVHVESPNNVGVRPEGALHARFCVVQDVRRFIVASCMLFLGYNSQMSVLTSISRGTQAHDRVAVFCNECHAQRDRMELLNRKVTCTMQGLFTKSCERNPVRVMPLTGLCREAVIMQSCLRSTDQFDRNKSDKLKEANATLIDSLACCNGINQNESMATMIATLL